MEDLPLEDVQAILEASRLGVLAMSDGPDAYAIPLFYGYDGEAVYFHCHPGMKDEYFDATGHACLVVIHLESDDIWESVQVFGSIEKLTLSQDLEAAKSALFKVPFPPAEGHFPHGKPVRTEHNVYYARLTPDRYAGKASSPKE